MTNIYKMFEVHYRKKGKPDKRYVLAQDEEHAKEIVVKNHGNVVFGDIFFISFLSPWSDYDLDLERVCGKSVQGLLNRINEEKRKSELRLRYSLNVWRIGYESGYQDAIDEVIEIIKEKR